MHRNDLIEDILASSNTNQRLMKAQFHRSFEQLGLSPSQLQVIMVIEHAKSVAFKDLASKMHLTPGAITQIVEPMVRQVLLERSTNASDRRIVNISLSPAGKTKMAELKKAREAVYSKLLQDLDDHELETFLRIQQKMVSYLERESGTTEANTATKEKTV